MGKFRSLSQRNIPDGVSLTASSSGNLHYLADFKSKGDLSVTKAYKFMSISVGSDPFFTAMSDCQI